MSNEGIRVAVIGTGLMGGSLALALKDAQRISTVACYDLSEETRRSAESMEIADEVLDSAYDAAAGSDFVFLAVPVGEIARVFTEIKDNLKKGAVVSDLGSTKMRVTTAIDAVTPEGVSYVGGHPMTGSEQYGVEAARADLYRDCYYILTPTPNTSTEAFGRLHVLLNSIGARVISMEPEAHDRAMATVSHVPHLLSLLLMDMARRQNEKMKNLFTVAAGGFRDMTRIAASNPDMWIDICMDNSDLIIAGLQEYSSDIEELVGALQKGDRSGLTDLFVSARRARGELSLKGGQEIGDMYEVSMPVPDEPGIISTISTAVGALGINIEDITIVHPLEGETGLLTLKIIGEDDARRVEGELQGRGYRASLRGA